MDRDRRNLLAGLATLSAGVAAPATAEAEPETAPAPKLGLSKRQLEREVAWLLRRPSNDPVQLAQQLCAAMVTLITKNNAKLAEQLSSTHVDPPDTF